MSGGPRITRRSVFLAAAALPLGACNSTDSTFYGVSMKSWGDAMKVAVGIEDQPGITLEQAASIPYSTIGYTVGSQVERMLVLANSNEGELLWTSSEHRSLVTRGGRITKSARFEWNLTDSQFPVGDPVITNLLEELPNQPIERLCDFQDLGRYAVRISGTFERKGSETITLLGQKIATVIVAETGRSETLDWNFQNTFWADQQTGFVWRSEQTIHPNLDTLTIEVLRPPA